MSWLKEEALVSSLLEKDELTEKGRDKKYEKCVLVENTGNRRYNRK